MVQIQPQTRTWKNKVTAWLQSVQHKRQVFGYDIRSAVGRTQPSFPSNGVLRLLIDVAKDRVARYIRLAIKEAADSLNVTLNDQELDLLTDLAIEEI